MNAQNNMIQHEADIHGVDWDLGGLNEDYSYEDSIAQHQHDLVVGSHWTLIALMTVLALVALLMVRKLYSYQVFRLRRRKSHKVQRFKRT